METKFKVYFDASIAGAKDYLKNYKAVVQFLKENDCQVSQSVLKAAKKEDKKDDINPERGREIYKKIMKEIEACDFMVAELTYGSPSLAMIIDEAIYHYKKPVLVLLHESKEGRPGIPFIANTSKLLYVEKYSFGNLEKIIKHFIKKIENKIPSAKFTVRLDQELDDYLAYKKLSTGEVSKNQIILNFLRDSMEEDKGYARFLKDRKY